MSKKDLSNVYNKLSLAIQGNFDKQVEITGKVTNISENQFTIRSNDNARSIQCLVKQSVENINVDDEIFVGGWIKLCMDSFVVSILVEQYYLLSDSDKYSDMSKVYKKIRKSLETDKYRIICKKHRKVSQPKYIYNIGLVCFPGTNPAEFKENFERKCYGKLFVYHSTTNISIPLEYFRKYHNIDIIILLANNIDLTRIYQVSTIENIKFLLHRKNFPFIVSVNDSDEIFPLTNMLSNLTLDSTIRAIDLISNSQTLFDRSLENAVSFGKNLLRQYIRDKRDKLLKLQIVLAELADPSWMTIGSAESSNDRIKNLLAGQLIQFYCEMSNQYQEIMKSIIEDPRIEQTFAPIIESEKDYDFNPNIIPGFRNSNEDIDQYETNDLV